MNKIREKIAVIGGGISGILSAYLLSKKHDVTIFDQADYLGGHTNTVTISEGPDKGLSIDTGFIVLNDRTYPTLHTFLRELKVPVRYTNMSFSVYCEERNFAFGSLNLNMLFAQRANLVNPSFYKMLIDIKKFWDSAKTTLSGEIQADFTLNDFFIKYSISEKVISDYIIPIAGSIWSSSSSGIRDFPAETFLRFFEKHGLLGYYDQPRWQTVCGSSNEYVKKFIKVFSGKINLNSPIKSVRRENSKVFISTTLPNSISEEFDKVVFAVHADQVLSILEKPTEEEIEIFTPWKYQINDTYLHTDESFLPPVKRAWASWNYRKELDANINDPVSITYYMNALQGFKTNKNYCVTLNPRRPIFLEDTIKRIRYEHPNYTPDTLASQKRLSSLQGKLSTYYAGSYFGFGFHEDAAASAASVGKLFGLSL